jgi:hypothetical protein
MITSLQCCGPPSFVPSLVLDAGICQGTKYSSYSQEVTMTNSSGAHPMNQQRSNSWQLKRQHLEQDVFGVWKPV